MFCTKCGKQIRDGQAFCPHCGSKVSGPAAQPQAYIPAQPQPIPSQYAYGSMPQPKKRTGLYIGIGVGGALLLALLVFLGARFISGLNNSGDGKSAAAAQISGTPEADAQLPVRSIAPSQHGEVVKPITTAAPAQPANTPAALSLKDILPGQWASIPDQDYSAYIYAFTGDGQVGNALAFSDGEETLDNWSIPGVWELGEYDWDSWRIEGSTVVMADFDGELELTIAAESKDRILISYPQSEPLSFYRVGGEPSDSEFLIGTWVPDKPDKNDIYAAFTFGADGEANLTGATKEDASATAQEWGAPYYWSEVDGSRDGEWRMDGEELIISMQGRTDNYRYTIDGPSHCVLYYGESWQMGYTRVAMGY